MKRAGIRPDLVAKVRTILSQLDEARTIDDMRLSSFHLHPLKGDMKGLWSVTVRANWRIVFRFSGGGAGDVELIDYHYRENLTPLKTPPHPGLSVRLNCLDPFALSVTEGAKVLGVSRTTLS